MGKLMTLPFRPPPPPINLKSSLKKSTLSLPSMLHRDDFKFIGGGGGRYLLQIKESLMIQKWNPELNGSVISLPIHLF